MQSWDFIHVGKNTLCKLIIELSPASWKIIAEVYTKERLLVDRHEWKIEGFLLAAFKMAMGIR